MPNHVYRICLLGFGDCTELRGKEQYRALRRFLEALIEVRDLVLSTTDGVDVIEFVLTAQEHPPHLRSFINKHFIHLELAFNLPYVKSTWSHFASRSNMVLMLQPTYKDREQLTIVKNTASLCRTQNKPFVEFGTEKKQSKWRLPGMDERVISALTAALIQVYEWNV